MILKEVEGKARLFVIDLGLGKYSQKVEDQAVDLYLLYEALKAAHFKYLNAAWQKILKSYRQHYTQASDVLKRLEKIEKRRRYKHG
jgi:Kae1-associated kinase Bud32